MQLSAKVIFGYFGIPLFPFFKILTLNRNINSVTFGFFLGVHQDFCEIFFQTENLLLAC
jgi:hypothetical protein